MIVVAVISFLSFRSSLEYFFVDPDTFSLIETGRLESAVDIRRVLTSDLFGEVRQDYVYDNDELIWPNFDLARYYRPVTILSLSADYAIWGLEPYGYHLTDLLLHIAAAWLVYFLARQLTGSQMVAAVATLIFSVHPLLFETIPSSSRRFETLFTLFFLATLLFMMKYLEGGRYAWAMLPMSLLAYLLALGSKETALIGPAILFAYLWFVQHAEMSDRRSRTIAVARQTIPFLAVAGLFFAWRLYVLGSMGGYATGPMNLFQFLAHTWAIIEQFFTSLLYPGGFAGQVKDPVTGAIISIGAATALVLIFALIMLGRDHMEGTPGTSSIRKTVNALLIASVIISLAGLVSRQATGNIGNLVASRGGQGSIKPESIQAGCLATLVVAGLLLALAHRREFTRSLPGRQHARLLPFLLAWLLAPLALFIVTRIFFNRYMYFSLVPFAIAVAIVSVPAIAAAGSRIRGCCSESPRRPVRLARNFCGCFLALVAVTSFTFLPSITPFNDSELWQDNSIFTQAFFNRITPFVDNIPQDASVFLMHFPSGFVVERQAVMAQQEFLPRDYSVKSWLNLKYPRNDIYFKVQNENIWLTLNRSRYEMDIRSYGSGDYLIEMRYPDLGPRSG